MRSITRQPSAYAEICRFDVTGEKMIGVLSANWADLKKQAEYPVSFSMTDYFFQTQIDSISGSFAISVLPDEIDSSGKSLVDLVEIQDIVKIYEFGSIAFVGIVDNCQYGASMGAGGKVSRKISISGVSVGGLLENLSFVLDRHLMDNSPDVCAANKDLFNEISKNFGVNQSADKAIQSIVKSFFDVMTKTEIANASVAKHIIEDYIDLSKVGRGVRFRYSVAISYYATGENSLWQILKDLFPPPVYEMFLEFDKQKGVYRLILRECPFPIQNSAGVWDMRAWEAIDKVNVSLDLLKSYDLSKSAADVYTYYLGLLPGSGITKEMAMVTDEANYSASKDTKRIAKYGFRPMYIEQKFFDRDENKNKGHNARSLMKEISDKAMSWFGFNDVSYSGQVELINYGALPTVGNRIEMIDSQFYVERSGHYWSYGKSMTVRLLVTRGLSYAKGTVEAIRNITKKLGGDIKETEDFAFNASKSVRR